MNASRSVLLVVVASLSLPIRQRDGLLMLIREAAPIPCLVLLKFLSDIFSSDLANLLTFLNADTLVYQATCCSESFVHTFIVLNHS